jgi:hypothetical protein
MSLHDIYIYIYKKVVVPGKNQNTHASNAAMCPK